jgi:hypothetical protein
MAKQMIKRADGSTSQRGLWDNIRANKGSGKKPTSAMLKQEKKIKGKKAEGGITLAKDPNTDEKNALNFTMTKENKNLSDVTKRETAGEALKGFYKKDYLGADKPGRTEAGKTLRKIGNTAIKAAFTPQALMATGLRAGSTAKGNKAELSRMKMGGSLKPVDKTKKPGLAKLPTAVRNKMGYKKNGGVMSKKK